MSDGVNERTLIACTARLLTPHVPPHTFVGHAMKQRQSQLNSQNSVSSHRSEGKLGSEDKFSSANSRNFDSWKSMIYCSTL